jgi:hypothetical protein
MMPNVRTSDDSFAARLTSAKANLMQAEQNLMQAEQNKKQAREALNGVLAHTTVKCLGCCHKEGFSKGCGAEHKICNLTYIRTHHYVRPYGCTEGDYWVESEGAFICPSCGHRNRTYERKEIQALQHLFKNIVEEHNR